VLRLCERSLWRSRGATVVAVVAVLDRCPAPPPDFLFRGRLRKTLA
jgi:K+/H+ antiporter YhaU regulatory subunit KhtT